MHFEVESDRDVTVDAIGLLEAGVPVVVSDEALAHFVVLNKVRLAEANFPSFIKVTAVIESEVK
jgi:hypothetical protein